MHLQESGEMYLESIHVLLHQRGQVRAVDVSEYMGYSKPSVSRAIGLLREGGVKDPELVQLPRQLILRCGRIRALLLRVHGYVKGRRAAKRPAICVRATTRARSPALE